MKRIYYRYGILLAISLFASLWSLYIEYFWDPVVNILDGVLFDLNRGIVACTLCRYIRMCMYPIVIISTIALIRKQRNAYIFMQPLMAFGIGFSIRKRSLQHFALPSPGFCSPQVPCSMADVNYFWFISLALMGIVGFLVMLCITFYIAKLHKKHWLRDNLEVLKEDLTS